MPSETKVKLRESPLTSVTVALLVPAVPSGFLLLPQAIAPVNKEVPAALATVTVLDPALSVKQLMAVIVTVAPVSFVQVVCKYVPAGIALRPSPSPGWQLILPEAETVITLGELVAMVMFVPATRDVVALLRPLMAVMPPPLCATQEVLPLPSVESK